MNSPPPDIPPFVTESLELIKTALHRYQHCAVSFNGGKDATAILSLALISLGALPSPVPVTFVYFEPKDGLEFQEVRDYIGAVERQSGISVLRLGPDFKAGLAVLKDRGVDCVFLGTRASDPGGSSLSHFIQTSEGWPSMMRLHPLLTWSYDQVWQFLLSPVNAIGYCKLYDQGYSSLGDVMNTRKNPQLKDEMGGYRPAYTLKDNALERMGRL